MTAEGWTRNLLRPAWNAANRVFFGLRRRLHWRRDGYREVAEDKADLFGDLPPDQARAAEAREAELRRRYDLDALHGAATRLNYRENLYLLDLLDVVWPAAPPLPETPRVLDVGAKNWYYVRALYRFFQHTGNGPREVRLTGIELDAYRVYADWHSRYDYAAYFSRGLAGCRYLAGDFLAHRERYDVILLLFPFVLDRPLLEWGLPLEHFRPLEMLRHALSLLAPGGTVLIVNQGEAEACAQLALLQELGCGYRLHQRHDSPFMDYPEPRYVTLLTAADQSGTELPTPVVNR